MSFIDLDIHADRLSQLQVDLQATDTEVRQALRSALGKMARWMRTQSARGLSKELDLQQKAIRKRLKSFRARIKGKNVEVKIWYGLDPIDYSDLNPRQTRAGISAGKRRVPGAFIAPALSGSQKVFKREGPKRRMSRGRYSGQMRQPIEKQVVEISDQAGVWIEDEMLGSQQFDERFLTIFERELEWRTQKRK